jgi:predicted ester cyclase
MIMTTHSAPSDSHAEEVVLAFGDAINAEDFQRARTYVADQLEHTYPLGADHGAEAYFEQLERVRPKYDTSKVFVDGNDVGVFYNVTVGGVTMFASAWFKLENGKIRSFTVVFDPTPLLAVWSPSR